MPAFIPGLRLARAFYHEAVAPVIDAAAPRLAYSAALIGDGSEVLGYDDAMSSDHHWGPRVMLFLSAVDHAEAASRLRERLSQALPHQFRGYSTHFSAPKVGAGDDGTQILQVIDSGPINHRVEILTVDGYMRTHFGLGEAQRLRAADWLSLPQQKLLSFTAGEVFRDDLNLERIRQCFAWYPRDVWLYMLMCGWSRLGQDEHLAPRAGFVGDELGSALIAGRLVGSIMQLGFLLERRYAPYPKWFGKAFAELGCAAQLTPILRQIQSAAEFRGRERWLCAAYEVLNEMHNALNLTGRIEPAVIEFHGRGFKVSGGWRYAEALLESIEDKALRLLAAKRKIGGIDQFSDNTDLREAVGLRGRIAGLYD